MSARWALFRWLGGALFVVALATCAWWYVVWLDHPGPGGGAFAIAADVALFSVFALHHSLFARAPVRAAIGRVLPAPLERSFFVWTSSLLLIITCLLWQPAGGELYRHGGWLAAAHAALQLAGLLLVARAVGVIDPLELAGIRPPRSGTPTLKIVGPYHWVRHPIYLGWILATFGIAHMTADRLLFSTIAAFYLVVAVPFEERSLLAAFGPAYAEYRRRVRWRIIPLFY